MDFKLINASEPRGYKPTFCNCEMQMCKGQFIPSRIGQETCLWDLAQRQLLDLYPRIEVERYSTQILILYLLELEMCLPEVRPYEITDTSFSFEEMVD